MNDENWMKIVCLNECMKEGLKK